MTQHRQHNGIVDMLDDQDEAQAHNQAHYRAHNQAQYQTHKKTTAKSLQTDLDVIKQALAGLSTQMGSIKQRQAQDEHHDTEIDATVKSALSKAAKASIDAARLQAVLKTKKLYQTQTLDAKPSTQGATKLPQRTVKSTKSSLAQQKAAAHKLEEQGHKMAKTMQLALAPATMLAAGGGSGSATEQSPLAQAETMFGVGGQQAVEDRVIFDEYNKQWAAYVKAFDTKYDPEKYAKNLVKVEKELAKKAGEELDKAKKKLLDAAKKSAKDAMEGTKVDAKKSGVDARLKEYEKVAKNIVGHHIWYGNKGYGTGVVVAGAKNAYTPQAMTPQERAIFS